MVNPPAPTWERQTPHLWGYSAAMPTAIKRSAYECEENDSSNHYNYPNKSNRPSAFIPPKFQPREPPAPIQHVESGPIYPQTISTTFNRFVEPPPRLSNETSIRSDTSIPLVQQSPPMKTLVSSCKQLH